MSQALYRRYRSQRFSELVGQQSVTRVLRNAITRDRLNHAYLFCGPRGTGKTSVARIFAKAINCLNPQQGDCCGECEVCIAVAEGRAPDVIEIDAASYRKVEETREILIDRVGYAPLQYKRKVYIIDEVHMLSTHSFNAVLKTLEEPPEHVIFCLCTTEPHQLPLTILSRCLRFDFHRLPLGELAAHLNHIAGLEGFELADDAAHELAVLAEGSARDSISLLDQLLVYCEHEITLQSVRELFQLSDPQLLRDAADQLTQPESGALLAIWQDLARQGADAGQFLIRLAGEVKRRYLDSNDDAWRRSLVKLWEGLNLLKFESFPALLVELTLLSAQQAYRQASATPAPVQTAPASPPVPQSAAGRPTPQPAAPPSASRSQPPSYRPAGRSPQPAPAHPPATAQPVAPAVLSGRVNPPQAATPAAPEPTGGSSAPGAGWDSLLSQLKTSAVTTYALVKEGVHARLEGQLLRLIFDQDARPAYRFIQNPRHERPLANAVVAAYGAGVTPAVEVAGEPGSRVPLQVAAAAGIRPAADAPPVEILADVVGEAEEIGSDAFAKALPSTAVKSDNIDLVDELGAAIGQAGEPDSNARQATKQDVMRLFDAEELKD
jgi:DNA polymerase III subunit gamma/tau